MSTTALAMTRRGKTRAKSRLLQRCARSFVARQQLPEYLEPPEIETLIRVPYFQTWSQSRGRTPLCMFTKFNPLITKFRTLAPSLTYFFT